MQIYIAEGTQHTGPFDLETIKAGLRAGRYRPDQLAWYDGAPGWEPISRLPGMEGAFAPPPTAYPPAAAPYQAPPGYQNPYPSGPQAYYPPPANNARASRPWWLVAGVVVVGLAAMVSGVVLLSRGLGLDRTADRSSPTPADAPIITAPATPAADKAAPSVPPVAPAASAANTRHYASNRSRYTGNTAAHYVAFSFDYPDGWTLDETVQDEYVEARHYVRTSDGRNLPAETISFSYAFSRPGYSLAANLPVAGSQLLEMAATSLLGRFPEATKTPSRAGRFGRYPSQEQFLTSPADGSEPNLYFRQAIVAKPNSPGTDGMFVTILGSDPGGNPNAESLGKSGGLRTIEESFHFEP